MTAAASRRVTAAQAGVLLVAALVAALIASARGSSAATPVRYETVAVTTGAVTDRISATGSVAAQATVDLAFGTTGQRVTAVDVHPGQTVAKGQLLATVDDTAATLQVATAQAELTLATAQAPTTSAAGTGAAPADATAGGSAGGSAPSGSALAGSAPRTSCTTTTTNVEPAPATGSTGTSAGSTSEQPVASHSPRPTPGPTESTTPTPTTAPTRATSPTATSGPSTGSSPSAPSRHPTDGVTTTKTCTTTSGGRSTQTSGSSTSAARSTGSSGGTGGGGGGATSINDAQEQLTAAQATLAGTKLLAPQPGVITAVDLVVGALPGTPAVELRTTGLAVQVLVQEQDAPYVQAGQNVQLTFSALGLSGSGTVVAPPLEPQTGSGLASSVVSYPVTVSIVDPPPALLPGMSVSATWTAATRDQVLTVPTSAIQSGDAGYVVRVLDNGSPVTRSVTVGLSDSSLTEVTGGLSPGDQVVTGVRA
jgi:multidrug efflux pump subunit AcrA (membrane-fusion protein)